MNLETILDDLESAFAELQKERPSLQARKPVGFSRVIYGKDHFSGFLVNTPVWVVVSFSHGVALRTEPGGAEVTNRSIADVCQPLIGRWLRVRCGESLLHGTLENIEGRGLLFRDFFVPISAITVIELHAVDNTNH